MATEKVLTPQFRVSFPSVFTAESYEDGDPKFRITMVFDEGEDLTALKAAAKAAAVDKWGAKIPKNLRSPFRDGVEKEHLEGFAAGQIFVMASSKMKPGLVDRNMQTIIDQSDFYPGCYARATVNAFAYEVKGNRGVSFGIGNIQKLSEGEPLGGRTRAEDDFDALPPIEGGNADDVFSEEGSETAGGGGGEEDFLD